MVAFDNTILSLLIFPDADLRHGPDGQPLLHARERVLSLVEHLERSREQVTIPAPALAELLVTEGFDIPEMLDTLRRSSFLRVESFDQRAAVELAIRLRAAKSAGNVRDGLPITKNAMKFDRQIVAIALVCGARVLYSDDRNVAVFAAGCGLPVLRIADLPLPTSQQLLEFGNAPDS
ncbi:MAG: hypothetical protein JNL98_22845 [Bryobacterales bacterium]|nr:hypothetical protein [Bryobacterales bacterium]